jgi:sugar phosphate isomerase/epimerase
MIEIGARIHNLEDAEEILSHGFKMLEISLPCKGGESEAAAWKKLSDDRGLVLHGHGPNEGRPKDLEFLERETLPIFRDALDEAKRIGVVLLTLHFNVDTRWIPEETVGGKIELLKRLVSWGRERGVKVNIENLSEAADVLEPAFKNIPGLGLTLDFGHAMLTHRSSTAPEIIERLGDRITHLHLHDNHGGPGVKDDLHLIPGEGEVDFSGLFERLKAKDYHQRATLELKPHELDLGRERVMDSWENAPS